MERLSLSHVSGAPSSLRACLRWPEKHTLAKIIIIKKNNEIAPVMLAKGAKEDWADFAGIIKTKE